jgi:hypothetical protein
MDINTGSSIAQIVAVLSAAFFGSYKIWRKIDSRQQELHKSTMLLDSKLSRIENQFGPNGGGLREAVNNMSKTVLKIEDRVTKIGDDVAKLSGEFNQHIREGKN